MQKEGAEKIGELLPLRNVWVVGLMLLCNVLFNSFRFQWRVYIGVSDFASTLKRPSCLIQISPGFLIEHTGVQLQSNHNHHLIISSKSIEALGYYQVNKRTPILNSPNIF